MGSIHVQEILKDSGYVAVSPQSLEDMQQIIQGLEVDLRNTYDNYVCFEGERDQNHMKRYFNSAYNRAMEAWDASDLPSMGFSADILFQAKIKLEKYYDEQNKKIIQHEEALVRQVVNEMADEYTVELKKYIQQMNAQEIQDAQRRMLKQCTVIMGRALAYGGKLNNVVRDGTKQMQIKLASILEEEMKAAATTISTPPSSSIKKNLTENRNFVEEYDKAIEHRLQNTSDLNQVKMDHDAVVQLVNKGMKEEEKLEFSTHLDTRLINLVAFRQNMLSAAAENESSQICMYLTMKSLWVVAFTKKEGVVSINHKGSAAEFPALFAWMNIPCKPLLMSIKSNVDYLWGHDASAAVSSNSHHLMAHDNVLNFVRMGGTGREMTGRFFRAVRKSVQKCINEKMHHLTVIIPGWCTLEDRYFLRAACEDAGFRKTVMLNDSSVVAYQHLVCIPPTIGNVPCGKLVVVIATDETDVRMEVFSSSPDESGQHNGVQLVAVAVQKLRALLSNKEISGYSGDLNEIICSAYERALACVPASEQRRVAYYTSLTSHHLVADALNEVLGKEKKLKKLESLHGSAIFRPFRDFIKDARKLDQFLKSLTINPKLKLGEDGDNSSKTDVELHDDRDDELLNGKDALLNKCNAMERQLNDGSVSVGSITRRIIQDAIAQGRLAASENMISGREAQEIDELFRQYSFRN